MEHNSVGPPEFAVEFLTINSVFTGSKGIKISLESLVEKLEGSMIKHTQCDEGIIMLAIEQSPEWT
jgi:hypothetical protein